MLNVIKILIISLMISACSSPPKEKIVYIPTPISRPTMQPLPKITGQEVDCLSDDTKMKLLKRDDIMKNYITDLEVIIDSTKKN